MKDLTKITIKTNNWEEKQAAAKFLATMTGLPNKTKSQNSHFYVYVDKTHIEASEDLLNLTEVPFNQIHTLLVGPEPVKVILNGDYTAVINENGITVGCQTFDHADAQKLLEAVQEVPKSLIDYAIRCADKLQVRAAEEFFRKMLNIEGVNAQGYGDITHNIVWVGQYADGKCYLTAANVLPPANRKIIDFKDIPSALITISENKPIKIESKQKQNISVKKDGIYYGDIRFEHRIAADLVEGVKKFQAQ